MAKLSGIWIYDSGKICRRYLLTPLDPPQVDNLYIRAVLKVCCKFHDTRKSLLVLNSIIMPEITDSDALVLVTGATGFIGTWIIETLLRNGYRVRAAVRTKEKGQHLLEIYQNHGTKLTLSVIGDMSKVKSPKISGTFFTVCSLTGVGNRVR
jgi:hypothetical protein